MWPLPNPLDLFGDAVSTVTGWAWGKVIQGIYSWFGSGLLLLMEWVWGVLDSSSTPRLLEGWFQSELVRPIAGIALAVTVAMMLVSAIQAGFGGRPELILDALKEGPKSIAATAVTLVVIDKMIEGADVLSDVIWQAGRDDTMLVLDGLAATIGASGPLGMTFLGPLALLFGMIGLLTTTVTLFMRSTVLYVVAAFSPILWASSVSPTMRGTSRRLVHVVVALVLAKPAITLTLVVGVKLVANSTSFDGGPASPADALGQLMTGFTCFAMAGLSPWVIYRLLPSVEQAAVSSGIAGGWGRTAMGLAQGAMMVKSFGAASAASAATRPIPSAASAAAGASSQGQPTGAKGGSTQLRDAASGGVPTASRRPSTPRRQEPDEPSAAPAPDPDRERR
jgi:hypothetical protein